MGTQILTFGRFARKKKKAEVLMSLDQWYKECLFFQVTGVVMQIQSQAVRVKPGTH